MIRGSGGIAGGCGAQGDDGWGDGEVAPAAIRRAMVFM
jgi:hypothetical protein